MDDSAPHFCDNKTDILRIASNVPATAHPSASAPFPHGLAALKEWCAVLLTKCTSIASHHNTDRVSCQQLFSPGGK